ELPGDQREGEARRVDLQLEFAEQVRQRADVVLMAVGEHHGLDLIGVLAQVLEVGQDQVDARHLRLGEGQPCVQDQDAAVHLEGGHVAADLADAAEEDDARIVSGRGGGRCHGLEGKRFVQLSRTPESTMACRMRARSSSVAGTSGRRGGPTGRPAISSAAFSGIGFDTMNSPRYRGMSSWWIFRAADASPAVVSSTMSR